MALLYQKIIFLLLSYKYLIFFPLVMLEGPITTIIAGFLSSLGYMNFALTFFLAAIADLTSDAGYYLLGRWGRKRIIEKYGHYLGITLPRLERLENQFKNHDRKILAFGKIADPLSSTIQTIAGLTKMNFRKYLFWNIIITFPKSFILLTIGFYFGKALNQVDFYQRLVGVVASVLGIVIIIGYFICRRLIERKIEKYGKSSN